MDERRRAYFYRIATAGIGLLILVGWIADDLAGGVLVLVAAILGLPVGGLASVNSSTKLIRPDQHGDV